MKALEIVKSAQGLPATLQSKISNMLPSQSPVDHLANLINLIEAEVKAFKSQEAHLASERKTLEALVAMANDSILQEMTDEGLTEVAGGLVKYVFRLNPASLVIEDETMIPAEYKRSIIVNEIRKDAIKDEMKMGREIPGCKLVQKTSIQLKANN